MKDTQYPDLKSRWANKLGAMNIRELWLTPNTRARGKKARDSTEGDSSMHVGQYVCTFAELLACNASLFSLLKKWEPSCEVLSGDAADQRA